MLIRKQKEPNIIHAKAREGLWEAKLGKEKFKFKHAQNVTPILEFAHQMREHSSNGFTKDKGMRMIGYIPELELAKHPEWLKDPNEIVKWLKTDEGAPYRTVKKGI
jgi:hypothetical protein